MNTQRTGPPTAAQLNARSHRHGDGTFKAFDHHQSSQTLGGNMGASHEDVCLTRGELFTTGVIDGLVSARDAGVARAIIHGRVGDLRRTHIRNSRFDIGDYIVGQGAWQTGMWVHSTLQDVRADSLELHYPVLMGDGNFMSGIFRETDARGAVISGGSIGGDWSGSDVRGAVLACELEGVAADIDLPLVYDHLTSFPSGYDPADYPGTWVMSDDQRYTRHDAESAPPCSKWENDFGHYVDGGYFEESTFAVRIPKVGASTRIKNVEFSDCHTEELSVTNSKYNMGSVRGLRHAWGSVFRQASIDGDVGALDDCSFTRSTLKPGSRQTGYWRNTIFRDVDARGVTLGGTIGMGDGDFISGNWSHSNARDTVIVGGKLMGRWDGSDFSGATLDTDLSGIEPPPAWSHRLLYDETTVFAADYDPASHPELWASRAGR